MPAAARHFDLAPHCSLTPRTALLFFGSVCFATFGVAGAATLMGYWPVLPFAGAEMLLLGWALKTSMDRGHEREHIDVTETEVIIEYSTGAPRRVVFPRHWARVKIRRPKSRLHRAHLVIESHGRAYEVGKFLSEEERLHLASHLGRVIGGMNQSPAMPVAGSHD
ncbi:MAG: DUF2244 domain-containing protein [Steroidobacteraceae bacterium]|nr:DUF2244 domain-containing protein [Steroidobacteraceae bacterium]